MKKHLFIQAITFLIFLFGSIEMMTAQEKEEKTLLKAIETFNQAFKEGNIEKLQSMITERYQHTNGSSKSIHRDTWLSYLRKRKKEIETGTLVMHTYTMTETEVQMYDDIAIVTAKITTTSTKSGELQENEYRVTNIWVRENNLWKRAAFHDGKIK